MDAYVIENLPGECLTSLLNLIFNHNYCQKVFLCSSRPAKKFGPIDFHSQPSIMKWQNEHSIQQYLVLTYIRRVANTERLNSNLNFEISVFFGKKRLNANVFVPVAYLRTPLSNKNSQPPSLSLPQQISTIDPIQIKITLFCAVTEY